ncbi:hypothetical protein ACQ4PT_045925 [Festuca glaucescens]
MTCLLYLSVFPSNRPPKRKVLIRRWLAEGYARSDSLRSEEDIAGETFKTLIDRNIIQSIETRNDAQVKTFKTHAIMHEFLLHKSMSKGFIATSSRNHPRPCAYLNNACHLSVHGGSLTDSEASEEDLSRVRSLTVSGKAGDAISYVRKCKLLRVLDLDECNDLEDHHLKHIGKLWHLKYLSVGGTIEKLPSSIEGLHCLETLDLRRTKIKTLPIEAIMLYHLTHLFGKFTIDKDDLRNANKMSKVVKFLSGNKSNLKTLAGFLKELSISSATLTRDLLSSLINLGNLLYLKLIVNQLENFEMRKGAFPSLRHLCFVVRSLASPLPAIEQGALPNIVSLQLLCPGLVGLSGIQIRHLRHLKEVTIDRAVADQTRTDWEEATKNHPNRPRLLLFKNGDPMESEGPGHEEASAMREKRKICVVQPSSDLDSGLKKMRLSESSSRLQVIVHSNSSMQL